MPLRRFSELWLIQVEPPLNVTRYFLFCVNFRSKYPFVGDIFATFSINITCVM